MAAGPDQSMADLSTRSLDFDEGGWRSLLSLKTLRRFWLDHRDVYTGKRFEHRGLVVHPGCRLRQLWDIMVVLLLGYISIVTPVEMGMDADLGTPIQTLPVDVFFFLDLVFNFFTGVRVIDNTTTGETREQMALDWKQVGSLYFKSWFWVDLVSTIPWSLVFERVVGETHAPLLKLTRLIRILRLLKLIDMFNRFKYWSTMKFNFRGVITNVLIIVLLLHWTACAWFATTLAQGLGDETWVGRPDIAHLGIAEASIAGRYLRSMYWTAMTLSTVGYGDIVPTTNIERIFAVVAMVGGSTSFAFLCVQLSHMMSRSDMASNRAKSYTDMLFEYLDHARVPWDVKRDVILYVQYKEQQTCEFLRETELHANLPDSLRHDMCLFIHASEATALREMPMLEGVSEYVIKQLVTRLYTLVYPANEVIIIEDEIGSSMYFVQRGRLLVVKKMVQLARLGPGDHFGDVALYAGGYWRTASVLSLTTATLSVLDKKDINNVLNNHPNLLAKVQLRAQDIYKQTTVFNQKRVESLQKKSHIKLQLTRTDISSNKVKLNPTIAEKTFEDLVTFRSNLENLTSVLEKLTGVNDMHSLNQRPSKTSVKTPNTRGDFGEIQEEENSDQQ